MEGKSKLGLRTLGAVEISVTTISQGCARAGQRAYTPIDRDPGEKRTLCICRCFRECVSRNGIPKRDKIIRRVAIVFVGDQDKSCAHEINPASRIVVLLACLLQKVLDGLHIDSDVFYA